MFPAEFIEGLADAGYPFADDEPGYCTRCGWSCTCDQLETPEP